jgi:hypothetical protein
LHATIAQRTTPGAQRVRVFIEGSESARVQRVGSGPFTRGGTRGR